MKKLVVESAIVKENISVIKRKADSAVIIADLSCDAQGLGLLKTAALLRAEGISNFAVYEVEDAEKLRAGGFVDEHILMLRSTVDVDEIGRLAENNVTCTIGSNDAGIAANHPEKLTQREIILNDILDLTDQHRGDQIVHDG